MALKIKLIEELGHQVTKVTVDGQPVSAKKKVSVSDLWKFYRDREKQESDEIIEIQKST
jgi:hypothetical protein